MDNYSATSYASSVNLSRDSSTFSMDITDDSSPILSNAVDSVDRILSNQTKAIRHLASQFKYSSWSISQLKNSLITLNNTLHRGGKIVLSGMGKSFKISTKTVATLNSLGLHAANLHPSEALHGDLGIIKDGLDSLIIISASGNSPELSLMLQHIPLSVPVILVTCSKKGALSNHPKVTSLLYAELPSHLSEKNLYGLNAPTISTTLCLSLLDAVSIALSELNVSDLNIRQALFGFWHPGGDIGAKFRQSLAGKMSSETKDEKEAAVANPAEKDNLYKSHNEVNNDLNISVENDKSADEEKDKDESFLKLSDIATLRAYRESELVSTITKFPESELEFLQLISLNEYLVIDSNDKKAILNCESAREIYRQVKKDEQEWYEINWRLKEVMIDI
ncbi:hypothetical protein DAMA08_026280 [Martiniozyma asiatica (nom. inval.)]|nr:hypothetical protein DAMA08_026280 [Martiniozyma asiatica]